MRGRAAVRAFGPVFADHGLWVSRRRSGDIEGDCSCLVLIVLLAAAATVTGLLVGVLFKTVVLFLSGLV